MNSYSQLIAHLEQLKIQYPSTKIIYANLGTTGLNNTPKGAETHKKIAEAVQKLPHVQLVIAAPFFERKSYPNVHWLPQVPQLDMLRYADLMITHGGLNSICECLQAGVPMLLCPLGHTADHFGNAARVVYQGWGLTYDVQKAPKNIIETTISALMEQGKNFLQTSKQPLKQVFMTDFAK